MRCQARRGRRRGGVLSQAQIPGPLQRSPSGRGGGSDGGRSDAGRLKPTIGRTCLRGTQTRRPRCREHPDSGAKQTAGMRAGPHMARRSSPGRGSWPDWCTIRREPPGPPARLWQKLPREDSAKPDPTPGRTSDFGPDARRRLARETHAAGIDAERGAGRSHIYLLRQVASGASSETNFYHPEDENLTGREACEVSSPPQGGRCPSQKQFVLP